ncbi:MAG: hypothetical protein HOL70_19450, partial [Candidatus Marinimicrobia bacterium]|nr:hypothetical protein [Candidatus Neomarinimicrobiota bacterium]
MTKPWNILTQTSDTRLYEARAQLHQAAQLLAAAGISYLEARPDDSHTAMLWSPETNQFMSQAFGEDLSFQITLNPTNLSLSIIESGVSIQKLDLNGSSLKQVSEKLQSTLESLGLPENVFTMEKHYDLPDYPDNWETAFDTSDIDAFQVIASSYINAYSSLQEMASTDSQASDLLIWPHHFDLAYLITRAQDEQGNLSKSVGVGISPGDGSYTAPYYYVTAWPAPSVDQIPGELK